MNTGRAFAIVLRQAYLMRGSPARVLPLFAWVAVDESLSATQLVGGGLVVVGIALVKLDDADEDELSGTPEATVVVQSEP